METSARRELEILRYRHFVSREIDEAEFGRLVEKLALPLSPSERAELGIAVTPAGVPAHPFPTPPIASVAARTLGPSGGRGGAFVTSLASRSEMDLRPGAVLLGQWQVERELGRGAFGVVLLVEDLTLRQRQAVKVLDPAMVARRDLLERFRGEVRATRRLVHPRIVTVYDYREDLAEGLALFSMEFISGTSVAGLIEKCRERSARVPFRLAALILRQVLEALGAAHAQGMIHRDVTPTNVLLAAGTAEEILERPDGDPEVKLVDFGIAGALEQGEHNERSRVLGTAAYTAPEIQLPNAPITPAVDVYGAGAVAYELVTGQPPLGRYLDPSHYRPDLPRTFEELILRLLDREPGRRPTAEAALRAVGAVLGPPAMDVPVPKAVPPAVPPVPRPRNAVREEKPMPAPDWAQEDAAPPLPLPRLPTRPVPPVPRSTAGGTPEKGALVAVVAVVGVAIVSLCVWLVSTTLKPAPSPSAADVAPAVEPSAATGAGPLEQAPAVEEIEEPRSVVAKIESRLPIVVSGTSSVMPDYDDRKSGIHYSFAPGNLVDGDPRTCWQARAKGSGGRGEWIELGLDGERVVSSLEIANGFQRRDQLGDLFSMNCRIRNARLAFSDGSSESLFLASDQRGIVRFSFSPHRASRVRILVDDVWSGSQWQDLSVSEVALYGE